ncbi:M48 family metalloprotease [Lentzea sp. NPDC004789]
MLDHFLWSVLIAPVLVVTGGTVLADRIRPDLAVRVLAFSAVAAAAMSTVTLLAFALKASAELPVVARWGGWSVDVVVADAVQAPWVLWLSVVWTAVVVCAVTVASVRRRRVLREVRAEVGWLDAGDGDVVLVEDERVDAFAVPGWRGGPNRIVVSTGVLRVLDERQRAAVIAHERAHLVGDHHVLMWITRLSAIAHPLLWLVVHKVAYLVERAADEAAAAEAGQSRRAVARAIGVAALAAAGAETPRRGHVLAALGALPGVVPRRVSALLVPRQRRRWPSLALVLVCAATAVWTVECVLDLHELLVLASSR